MDIKQLDFILNDALNKALISKDRIKNPNSNNVADFVNKYITENKQALQLQQTGVVRSCSHNCTTNYCNSDGSYSHKMCDDCGDVIWD